MKKFVLFLSTAAIFLLGQQQVFAANSAIIQTCTSGHYSTTASCTLPSNLSNGTTLVAVGYGSQTGATISISGCGVTWTNVFSDTTSPNFTWDVWTAPSTTGTSCSPTQTNNHSDYNFLNVMEVQGIGTLDATPIDLRVDNSTGTIGPLTTATNGDMVLFVGFIPGSQFTYSGFTNGFNIDQQNVFTTESGGLGSNADAHLVQPTAGSISTTWNYSGYTFDAGSLLMAFKSSGSGGGDTQAPTIPASLSATAVSSSAINLSWTASTDNVGVTGYTIYRGGVQIGTSATNSYSDTGLSPSTQYTYTISAQDAAGNTSAQSSSASATTQANQTDTTPPSTPTNLSATAVSSSAINLSWTASTDNVGVTGYKIYRGSVQVGTSNTNSYSDSGLSASTQYSYTVSAYDAAGNNSSQSGSASATTQAQQQAGNYLWSNLLDPSRAIDWSKAGFTIPNYSTNCSIQPTLTANSQSAAAANATSIQNALNSCDSTHNVVNIPAGTYYVNGITYGSQGNQVLRGAGGSATYLYIMSLAGCGGIGHGLCMIAPDWTYSGASNVLPPSGSNQCTWTAGYAQGSTNITLSNCGGTPPVNKTLVLDQANDTSDTGGVYMCDGSTSDCTYEGGRNAAGRIIGTNLYSNEQVVYITGVTSLGGGSYSLTISPGLYMTNIRSSQNPGAWWPGFVQHDGLENMTIDMTNTAVSGSGNVGMFSCYQCWVTGSRLIDGYRNHVWLFQSMGDVIRNNYFYQSPGHAATSYTIEPETASNFLVENNIFQQVTTPYVSTGGAVGGVFAYNFAIKNIFADGSWTWPVFVSHSAGTVFDLFEGNDAYGAESDNASGPSDQLTMFRNLMTGYQPGSPNNTEPTTLAATNRNYNFVGNVLGQTGIQSNYQAYAASPTIFIGAGTIPIYNLGEGGTGGACALNPSVSTLCDPLSFSTLMRWGNYDVVNAATQWNTTEASPAAVPYINSNFSPSYFSSLSHTLPASLYYNSTPSWWPSGKPWPPIGPDVSSGNVGVCSGGTYAGVQATKASQCTGGTLTTAWASHANSIPAQDCYLNVMGGPPDGSGSVLPFDASTCYGVSTPDTTPPSTPTGLSASTISSSAINLSWTASTDNLGVTGYKVFRNGTQIGTSVTNSYSDTGLTASTLYSYTVSAYDAASNTSAQSSSASATTQASAVPVPGDLNLDHIVNSLDFSLLNSKWNTNYPSYDLYPDGIINALDYAVMSSNWGKTW